MGQNCKLWVRPVCAQTVNFETLLRHSLSLMMGYFWYKFQQVRAIFRGLKANKPPKWPHFMAAALPRNHLKIYNFGTTNFIVMKLTTNMYLHVTFHFRKN